MPALGGERGREFVRDLLQLALRLVQHDTIAFLQMKRGRENVRHVFQPHGEEQHGALAHELSGAHPRGVARVPFLAHALAPGIGGRGGGAGVGIECCVEVGDALALKTDPNPFRKLQHVVLPEGREFIQHLGPRLAQIRQREFTAARGDMRKHDQVVEQMAVGKGHGSSSEGG